MLNMKNFTSLWIPLLFLCSILLSFYRITAVEASTTIYIRADGSIYPLSAPISTVDHVTYVFTNKINDSIVVERDDIVIDGAGYTIQGAEVVDSFSQAGISLYRRSNVTIENMTIKSFYYGITLSDSSGNVIFGNNITANKRHTITLSDSSGNVIFGNNITANNLRGIKLVESQDNVISGNNITANGCHGITLSDSSGNVIFGNNITGSIGDGIALVGSSNNIISGNSLTENKYCGIRLYCSLNNTFRNNSMADNHCNFKVSDGFVNDVDASNTVDGKPVYYWINMQDLTVPFDAGFVALVNCTCITVQNLSITHNNPGMLLAFTTNSTIIKNDITNNELGIGLWESRGNTISGNNITASSLRGIGLWESRGNTISGNNIIRNRRGVLLSTSSNNNFYHNNFIRNSKDMYISMIGYPNFLDDGVEGNFWSDYAGVDADHDGIGDSSFLIDGNNTDRYPLMGMFSSFNTSLGSHVNVVSNSTIEDFEYFESNNAIKMHVSNVTANQTYGFCRICISHTLMNVNNISVIIDDGMTPVLYHNYTAYDNGTHRWIYFSYGHSRLEIVIVPEFSSMTILLVFMMATIQAVTVCKRKGST